MVLNVHRTIRLIRDGSDKGGRGYGGGGRRRLYTYRYTVTTEKNDSCIKMGSDKSHFNVSLIVRDKVTNKTVSTDHNFYRERRTEAGIRTKVPLTSQNRPTFCFSV